MKNTTQLIEKIFIVFRQGIKAEINTLRNHLPSRKKTCEMNLLQTITERINLTRKYTSPTPKGYNTANSNDCEQL